MSTLKIKRENGKIFCPLADSWHIETPEEKVRQEYIKILVEDYGYSLDQMAQEIKVNNSQRGQGKARADIVIWKSKQDKIESKAAFIVVECKAENVRIREEDYYQGYNYASWAGASFFVTTNEKETKYFNVDKDYLPKELVEVVAIPTAEEALNDKKVKDILSKTKTFTRDDFTKILRTCHNIIRNNDKLSPEAAFDEISKILFMKIKYEREQRGAKVFTKNEFVEKEKWFEKEIRPSLKGTPKDLPYMQFLFYNTKEEFKDDQLFEENEIIKIRQNSFEQILEKLETYNLSDTQDDVKGIAFEQFLGTTFRGELGQYFTPRTIVDFMTHILDPKENETVCDPTCGSGGFLIKAFEYMREKIEEDVKKAKSELRSVIEGENYDSLSEKEQVVINERIEAMQSTLNKELDTQVEGSRMYNLSRNCIYGTDANPRMARTSKMNMIMHGDGHGGVHHHDGLLNVNGIFEERFDVILTNPPFGARIDKSQKITEADKFTDEALIAKYKEKYGEAYEKALKQVNDNIGKSLLSLYDVGSMSGLTEVLFMERCLRLLKKGGRMGMVLPEGVLNTSNLQKIREYFEGKAKIILICSIPQDVFIAAGATVKPSLVFFKRFTEEEELQYLGAKTRAEKEIRQKYIGQIKALQEKIVEEKSKKLKVKALIAAAEKELRDLEKAIIEEAKPLTKEYFDYEIPIAMVEDAGITSTGAVSAGNQLPTLQDEYKEYGFSAKDLSEGEKKLILIRSVLSFVADENSLILFDEPDANIHEGRKQQLYNLFSEYCKFDRQMIVATHSPILAQLANEKELLMLELDEGKSTILTDEKIEKIKKLSGTSWDVIGQGMMLKSNRPLVVFEGKTDVKYVKRAIDLLKNDNPSYDQLQVDFMSAGGADNMQFFITDLLEVIPNSKKVIVFFDRDNEGQTGAATLLNLTTSDESIAHSDDVKQNNLTVSFIPYKTGVTGGDFLIEDYFSWDKTVKPMVDKAIENSHHPFKNLPKLSSRIKKGLEDKHMSFAKEEFEGFITLLDKIVKLSTEEGT